MQRFTLILRQCRPSSSRTMHLKGTVSQDFRQLKKTLPGPYVNRQKRFREIFRNAEFLDPLSKISFPRL